MKGTSLCSYCNRPLVSVLTLSALDHWTRVWFRLCDGSCDAKDHAAAANTAVPASTYAVPSEARNV